jgi:hypothetical protein
MKNTLAENMLRFGSKNLSEDSKKKLEKLAEQSATNIVTRISKISTGLPTFLDKVTLGQEETQTTEVDIEKNLIFYYDNKPSESIGYLTVYKVIAGTGIPIITEQLNIINNQGSKWRTIDTRQGELPVTDANSQIKTLNQMNVPDRLVTVWEKWIAGKIPTNQDIIKNEALKIIANKQNAFKKVYQDVVTRSESGKKTFWSDTDNPNRLVQSQYYLTIVNPIATTKYAKLVLNLIQDTQLVNFIDYKVKNWNNTGKYPNNPYVLV